MLAMEFNKKKTLKGMNMFFRKIKNNFTLSGVADHWKQIDDEMRRKIKKLLNATWIGGNCNVDYLTGYTRTSIQISVLT